MKIVHVTSGRLFGGIEQMLVTVARSRSVTPEVDVAFAVAAPGRLEEELRASGAEVHALGDVRLSRPASVAHARSRFKRLLRGGLPRPAIAVCHAPWSFALFAPVARRLGVSRVLWQHDHASGQSMIERWARKTPADLVVCNSRWTSQTAAALQPGVATTIVHPPVTIVEMADGMRDELRQSLGTDNGDVVILSASRLEPWKGHQNLIRALARLHGVPSWTLWIAGGAERPHEVRYTTELRAEIEQLGLTSRVRFLGARRDVPALMKAADILCQANNGPEPFGVVFAEALLSGIPVVTMDLGGAPEIVDPSCGQLVPPGDIDALAAALGQLISDSSLRLRLGSNGPAHARARVAPEVVLPQLARALSALGATAAA